MSPPGSADGHRARGGWLGSWAALAVAAWAVAACVPTEDDADGRPSWGGNDSFSVKEAASSDGVGPDGGPADTDACVLDDLGGTCTLLGGEVVLVVPAGALAERTTLDVTRQIVRAQGQDLVGYVWGPHGMPIDPVATVTVTVPEELLPSPPESAELVAFDDPAVVPLSNQTLQRVATRTWELTGEVKALLPTLIAPRGL
jgi:hypothetical protein